MDCYCCTGTIIFLYTQISWFLDMHECNDELPNIKIHMKREIIYQYARVAWYFISNLLVVAYILYVQKSFQMKLDAGSIGLQKEKKSVKSEHLSVELTR